MIQKFLIAYSVILSIAVGFLFFKVYKGPVQESTTTLSKNPTTTVTPVGTAVIAYVNIDTLTQKYTWAKKSNDDLFARRNNIERKYEADVSGWQKKYLQFQEKGRMGNMSEQEIQNTQQELAMGEERIVKQREKDLADLMEADRANTKKFTDEINSFIKEYNKDGKYKFIFSYVKNGNMLYADEAADITADVVNGLNEKAKAK